MKLGKISASGQLLGLIFLTGIIGSSLTRKQGLAVWNQFNSKLQSGALPGNELIDGLIVLCSGALLLTPGIITDFVGFLGLIPQSRLLLRSQIQRYLSKSQIQNSFRFTTSSFDNAPPSPDPSTPQTEWQGTPKQHPDYTNN